MKKLTVFLFGIVCYTVFLGTFLYAIGFVGNIAVPKTIDNSKPQNGFGGIILDMALLSVFALQHSIMARPAFKKWWTRFVPHEIERSTYVLLASLALILMFWQWRTYDAVIWNVQQPFANALLTAGYFLGWITVLLSTFMINHFDLFGLKQVFYHFRNKPADNMMFKTTWLYRVVRHPIMMGFLIAFWCTPLMTAGHLVFTLTSTAYILVAVKFLEEKDLEKSLGEQYKSYQRKVPMLIPFTK